MNKPNCLAQMDLPTVRAAMNGNVNLPRTDVAEILKWAFYQEAQEHEREAISLRTSEPTTLEEAKAEIQRLEQEIEKMEFD